MQFHEWFQEKIRDSGKTRRDISKESKLPKNRIDSLCNDMFPTNYEIVILSRSLKIDPDEMLSIVGNDPGPDANYLRKPTWPRSIDILSPRKTGKPGDKPKTSKIHNSRPRLHDLQIPDEKKCWICALPDDGTCYFHHCEVPYYKMKYGSGTAIKIDDRLTVWAHHKCGTELSVQPKKDDEEIVHLRYEVAWSRLIIENKYLMA